MDKSNSGGLSHAIQENSMENAPDELKKGPLTVFAKHKITPGMEKNFEKWVADIANIQRTGYKGFLGVEVIRPVCLETNEHVSIFRYDSYDHLQTWMDSSERIDMVEQACAFEQEPIRVSYHSLEYWFVGAKDEEQNDAPSSPPPRYKMALVTFFVIWLQVHYIPPNVGMIPNIPPLAAEAFGTFLIVILTTYVLMPIVTKYILFWFLFPTAKVNPYVALYKQMKEKMETRDDYTLGKKSQGSTTDNSTETTSAKHENEGTKSEESAV